MAEVNLPSWSEILQASEGLQLNSTAATWENILSRLARIESRLLEHERRAASTLLPLRPEPDPPDGPLPYTHQRQTHPNEYTQPHTSCNRVDWYNRSALIHGQPNHNPNFGGFPPHHIQQPQLQVLNSTLTYMASAISPTATTQSPSCHEQPIAVLQPLLSPPSHCHSAATLPAAAPPPPLPRYTVMGKPYGDQLPVINGSPEINADHSQINMADSDGNQIETTISNEENSYLPSENDGKVHTLQTWANHAAKKPLHSIDETRPGKGAPKEDSEEEFYDVEKDPAKDLQEEQVVWFKVEQYMLIEEKRSAELRAEELEIALMHRELYELRSALVEKHEQENARTRIQHGLHLVIFYGNNERSRPTIRCAFDPGGDSLPKLLIATLFAVSWFPP